MHNRVRRQAVPLIGAVVHSERNALREILASPEEVGDGICLIRGTVPPGVAVLLPSHPDLEFFMFSKARWKSSSRRKAPADGRL